MYVTLSVQAPARFCTMPLAAAVEYDPGEEALST